MVKTRLAATVGTDRALAIYEAMLSDVIASIGESTPEREIEYMWAPTAIANAETLHRAFGPRSTAMQTGADLGDRLSMAFSERFFFHRTNKIIAIGVDDPLIPAGLIDHAFQLLDSCEWVVGPATDGGYYLIGCRGAAFDVEVFSGIEWGTSSVLETTLEKIRKREHCVALLPQRSDIDVAGDLDRFAEESTHGALHELLKKTGLSAEEERQD
jgi:rSAM/selenodomain-associated transferase 1